MKSGRALWLVAGLLLAASVAVAQPPKFQRDIVYGHADDVDLKLDLATPGFGSGPFPAVVAIHGGAWQMGDKGGHEHTIRVLASKGYVAVSVDYRLGPKYKWPAQIEDVKCAVRYLRAHAKELNIDCDKVAALGDSAGGHLSLLLGLMDPKDGMEGSGGWPKQSSKVQAVVNYYGPTDLRLWLTSPDAARVATEQMGVTPEKVLTDFLGTADLKSDIVASVCPVTYINPGDPPILTFHGTKDTLVPIDQANLLHEALQKAGVRQELVILEGEGHGWGGEQLASTTARSIAFLDSIFRPSK